jgi:ketosteroid isomerase-like protein
VSQENVERARRGWQAYAERGVAGVLDAGLFTHDCVLEDATELPDGRSYVGLLGVIERDEHFAEMWEDFRMVPVEYIDGGENTVVVVARLIGRAVGSGVPLDAYVAFVYELRDGKVVRDRVFISKEAALAAVGLEG